MPNTADITDAEKQAMLTQFVAQQRKRLANDNARLMLELELLRRKVEEAQPKS